MYILSYKQFLHTSSLHPKKKSRRTFILLAHPFISVIPFSHSFHHLTQSLVPHDLTPFLFLSISLCLSLPLFLPSPCPGRCEWNIDYVRHLQNRINKDHLHTQKQTHKHTHTLSFSHPHTLPPTCSMTLTHPPCRLHT